MELLPITVVVFVAGCCYLQASARDRWWKQCSMEGEEWGNIWVERGPSETEWGMEGVDPSSTIVCPGPTVHWLNSKRRV